MEITLYSDFSKRNNSTKNPDTPGAISVSVTLNVALKEQCSKIKPSFFITDITDFVYCKAWDWYYYITNIAYDINGAQYIECELDVLGTWRDAIMSTRAFIRYSTKDFSTRIPDTRISTLTGITVESFNNLFGEIYSSQDMYQYYLSVLGESGIDDWLLTTNELRSIVNALIENGSDVFGSLTTQFTDAISCLIKCRVIPLSENAFSGTREGEHVMLGKYDTGVTGFHMARTWGYGQDFVTVNHPSDFRIMEPYSYCKVTLPFAGTFDFSLDELYDTNKLYFSYAYNASTGKISYRLYRDNPLAAESNANVLGQYNGDFGIDVPIGAQEMNNPIGTLSGVASLASMVLAPNPVTASATIASSRQAYMGMQKTTSMIGGYGGNGGWNLDRRLRVEVFSKELSANPDSMTELYGRPLDAVRELSGLAGGYVQTEGFHIDISAPKTIRDMIDQAMDSGVYLE